MGKEPLDSNKKLFPYGTITNRDGTPWLPPHLREGTLPGSKSDAEASNQTLDVKVDAGAEASPTACPFCGVDARDWDIEVCEHLLADFGDGSDGDRAILCGADGSRSGNAALDCLEDLEAAVKDFGVVAWGGDEDGMVNLVSEGEDDGLGKAGLAQLGQALYGDEAVPKWWQPLAESLKALLTSEDMVKAIWDTVAPWSPTLKETTAVVGGMTSSLVTFVWAQHPDQEVKAIADAVGRVTAEIEAARTRLVVQGWRPDGMGSAS